MHCPSTGGEVDTYIRMLRGHRDYTQGRYAEKLMLAMAAFDKRTPCIAEVNGNAGPAYTTFRVPVADA